ncbi:MAG: annexin, partial [Candidatus Eremiobacterota bacterium]
MDFNATAFHTGPTTCAGGNTSANTMAFTRSMQTGGLMLTGGTPQAMTYRGMPVTGCNQAFMMAQMLQAWMQTTQGSGNVGQPYPMYRPPGHCYCPHSGLPRTYYDLPQPYQQDHGEQPWQPHPRPFYEPPLSARQRQELERWEQEPRLKGNHQQGRRTEPQPAQSPRPQRAPYDANKDANALYKAMHGGLIGAGTDEDAIFKTLQGKSPQDLEKLKATYQDHYGRDLGKDLKSELSGTSLSRAEASLKGDQSSADADALYQAMKSGTGVGTDEEAIHQTLEGKNAEQRAAIEREYLNRHGRNLRSDLKSELSGAQRDRAEAHMEGNQAKADAAALNDAMKGGFVGLGTDEEAIYQTLKGKSAEQRAAIAREYKAKYAGELRSDLSKETSGTEHDRAGALLDGDQAGADAAEIRHAMKGGWLTDKESIQKALEGRSQAEREAILKSYKDRYRVDLQSDLHREMSGNDLEKTTKLLQHGKLTDAEKLKYAIEGAGTDEEAVKGVLKGKSREEVARLRADYEELTGRSLDSDLAEDLSGRDHFDAKQDLKGRPETVDEAVERINERKAYERDGAVNAVGRVLVDTFSDKGKTLEKNTDRVN